MFNFSVSREAVSSDLVSVSEVAGLHSHLMLQSRRRGGREQREAPHLHAWPTQGSKEGWEREGGQGESPLHFFSLPGVSKTQEGDSRWLHHRLAILLFCFVEL